MRKGGTTVLAVARAIGLSTGYVSTAFRKAGILPRNPHCIPVTPAILADIASRLAAGHTYTRIADELGTTRSRIAGIVHRHLRASVPVQAVVAAEETATATRDDTSRPVSATSQVAADTSAQPTTVRRAVADMPPIASNPISVVTAGPGACHWPLWSADDDLASKRVCGTACGRETYCPAHRALAYRPAESRRAA